MPRARRSVQARGDASPLVIAAERLVGQIEALVRDVADLREENDALRGELRDAVVTLDRATAAVEGTGRRASTDGTRGRRGKGRRAGKGPRGRATPAEVTPDVVRAVIAKLGPSTAAEIASEISQHGAAVSGRAVRFIAERGGAIVEVGPDGQRRYRLG